jgi:hypothetical protein
LEHGARLRLDDDEPMDLLQGTASRITSMHHSLALEWRLSYLFLVLRYWFRSTPQARSRGSSLQN